MKTNLSKIYFMNCAFDVASKKVIYGYLSFLLCLSLTCFIVLYFTFRSTAYFGLISVTGIKSVLFARECPVLTAPLVEKIILSPTELHWHRCQK